jgi:hypothetical protein
MSFCQREKIRYLHSLIIHSFIYPPCYISTTECFEAIDAENDECILADFTVAIRSFEMSLEEYEALKDKLSNAMKAYIRDDLDTCIREKMYGS